MTEAEVNAAVEKLVAAANEESEKASREYEEACRQKKYAAAENHTLRSSFLEEALETLKKRLSESGEFPHEIGLFLGYPPEDVEGFIENRGKNCKCVGCWKVYGDPEQAVRQFARFKKCREVYLRLYRDGKKSLDQLTVAS